MTGTSCACALCIQHTAHVQEWMRHIFQLPRLCVPSPSRPLLPESWGSHQIWSAREKQPLHLDKRSQAPPNFSKLSMKLDKLWSICAAELLFRNLLDLLILFCIMEMLIAPALRFGANLNGMMHLNDTRYWTTQQLLDVIVSSKNLTIVYFLNILIYDGYSFSWLSLFISQWSILSATQDRIVGPCLSDLPYCDFIPLRFLGLLWYFHQTLVFPSDGFNADSFLEGHPFE